MKPPTPPGGFVVPTKAQVMSAIEARAPQPWAPPATRPRQERFELVLKTCLVIAVIVAAAMLAMLGV